MAGGFRPSSFWLIDIRVGPWRQGDARAHTQTHTAEERGREGGRKRVGVRGWGRERGGEREIEREKGGKSDLCPECLRAD
jgi:hypothetical protein